MKYTKRRDEEIFVVKDQEFKALDEVKTDSKNRVSLGRKLHIRARFYKVYENSRGQIILDPLETVPAQEAWLLRNPEALESLKRGLSDLQSGRIQKSKESFTK